jgi:hypothetical protein
MSWKTLVFTSVPKRDGRHLPVSWQLCNLAEKLAGCRNTVQSGNNIRKRTGEA